MQAQLYGATSEKLEKDLHQAITFLHMVRFQENFTSRLNSTSRTEKNVGHPMQSRDKYRSPSLHSTQGKHVIITLFVD